MRKLLEVLHRLVESGNTVIVIEHNLEVIKTADWVIDLGPDGGSGGGRLVAEGPPEEIVRWPRATPASISPACCRAARRPRSALRERSSLLDLNRWSSVF